MLSIHSLVSLFSLLLTFSYYFPVHTTTTRILPPDTAPSLSPDSDYSRDSDVYKQPLCSSRMASCVLSHRVFSFPLFTFVCAVVSYRLLALASGTAVQNAFPIASSIPILSVSHISSCHSFLGRQFTLAASSKVALPPSSSTT